MIITEQPGCQNDQKRVYESWNKNPLSDYIVPIQKEAISGWSFQRSAISRQLSLYFKSLLLKAER
jgi:hypothetical protein